MKQIDLLKLCTKAITLNEIGHDPGLAYKFSDPDGVRTGKSGWSFGASQFDTQNNAWSWQILSRCGFKAKEIIGIINQTINAESLNFKLLASKNIIDVEDRKHVEDSLEHVVTYCGDRMSDETLVHLVDYHNQLDITPGGLMHSYANSISANRPITPDDVLWLKLNKTLWGRPVSKGGKGRADDVQRRFQNIQKICKGA
jgi:hypothetical protein